MNYALIKDGEVRNTIVADPEFVAAVVPTALGSGGGVGAHTTNQNSTAGSSGFIRVW